MNTWGQNQFGSIPQKIKKAQAELQDLNNNSDMADMMVQIQNKENELDKLLEKEEMWWSQRSRVQWLQHGDKNTKFFHQKASQRRQRNMIDAIQDREPLTMILREWKSLLPTISSLSLLARALTIWSRLLRW
jgi:predicted CoA-binding protein